jgi:hypothetical protein
MSAVELCVFLSITAFHIRFPFLRCSWQNWNFKYISSFLRVCDLGYMSCLELPSFKEVWLINSHNSLSLTSFHFLYWFASCSNGIHYFFTSFNYPFLNNTMNNYSQTSEYCDISLVFNGSVIVNSVKMVSLQVGKFLSYQKRNKTAEFLLYTAIHQFSLCFPSPTYAGLALFC